jgi:hypothetical protein
MIGVFISIALSILASQLSAKEEQEEQIKSPIVCGALSFADR